MTDTPPNDNEGVDGLADRAKEMLDRVKGGTADAADTGDGLADKAKSALSGITDKAKDAVSGAGDAVDSTVDAGAAVLSTSGGTTSPDHPYGPGSAAPLADKREMPACHPIKGNVDSMLYHRPDSQNYGATIAEVWFDSPSAAEAAGFTLSPTHPAASSAADYEPGGSGHPCSVADVNAGRSAVAASLGGVAAGGASTVAGNLDADADVAGDAGASMADKAADAAGNTTAKVAGAAAGVAGGVAAAGGGLADRAKGLVSSAKDKLDGDDDADDDKGAGIGGKLAGAAGGAAAAVGGLAGKAKDAAGSAVDSVQDAVSDGVDAVKDTADDGAAAVSSSAAAAGAGAAAAGATVSSTTTTVSGGGAAGGAGGSGSGGGGGGWFGDDDDDEEKLFADIPLSGTAQIFGLGLLAAAIMLFGSSVWGFFFPGDDAATASESIVAADEGPCADVLDELDDDDSVTRDDLSDVRCEFRNGQVILTGDVADLATKTNIGTVAGGATLGGALIANELNFDDADDADETEVAAETTTTAAPETTTTTTEAPETTTAAPETTEAPETTTEAPTTTAAAPYTMWQALNDSGEAGQFAAVGAALGLQADLEALVDEDGVEVNRTLFALSDESMALLDVPALAADPEGATALVGYHFIDQRLSAADLAERDGQAIITRTGLPMTITVDGDDILLNGNSLVISSDIEADNGIIHIITPALTPPTINEVIDLENIEFEVNSAVITAAGQAELQKAIDFFAANPTVTARIEGHTDTDGNDVSNQALSEARAESVKTFLVDNGVNGDNLDTIGFGETQPILDANGAEDKAASRRIEFNVR